ncbi:MAG: CRISPR-associated endonuclease Cas2 [Thermofilum sp.]
MEYAALVIYDIRDDKPRLGVARFLKRAGFTRFQKSAFTWIVKCSPPPTAHRLDSAQAAEAVRQQS